MATEIRVPTLGESVSEATIGKWFKKVGDAVKADEPLLELETDKVTLEVNAPAAGVLSEIVAHDGDTVGVGALLGNIAAGGTATASAAPAAAPAKAAAPAPAPAPVASTGHGPLQPPAKTDASPKAICSQPLPPVLPRQRQPLCARPRLRTMPAAKSVLK